MKHYLEHEEKFIKNYFTSIKHFHYINILRHNDRDILLLLLRTVFGMFWGSEYILNFE